MNLEKLKDLYKSYGIFIEKNEKNKDMKILKKDLEMYKYEYKIYNQLLYYCLNLIILKFKDNNDIVRFVVDLKNECYSIRNAINHLIDSKSDCLDVFFKNIEKSKLSSEKESFKTIKMHYELLAKLLKKD